LFFSSATGGRYAATRQAPRRRHRGLTLRRFLTSDPRAPGEASIRVRLNPITLGNYILCPDLVPLKPGCDKHSSYSAVGRGLWPTLLLIDIPLQSLTDLVTITPCIQSQFFPHRPFTVSVPALFARNTQPPPHLCRVSTTPTLSLSTTPQPTRVQPTRPHRRTIPRAQPGDPLNAPRQATSTPEASPLWVRRRRLHLHTGRLRHPPRRWDASASRIRDATSAPRCGRHCGLPRPNRTRCRAVVARPGT
jgi:hypothetical protein